jgi:hypothetical protein
VLTLENMAMDTFRVAVPGADVMDDPIWPFEALVVIRSGRSYAAGWSGGQIEFTGKRLLHSIDGRPDFEGIYYNFAGPWYDIHNTPYQQKTVSYDATNYPAPEFTGESLCSYVILFSKLVDGVLTFITTKTQIFDVLQHVLDQYDEQGMDAPFSLDLADIEPNVGLPIYPMQDVKCSEVIDYCLRPSPDARVWFDYSETPPAVHVQRRTNCTPVSLAIGDGVQHESLRITPRHDLQARCVVLYFLLTNEVDGVSWVQKYQQKYGPNGLNSVLDPNGGLRVIVETIDLQGFTQNSVYGSLSTLAATNDLAFWEVVIPELRSTQVRAFSTLTAMTVVDENGAAVSLATYPNALMDGSSLCPWMTIGGVPVSGKRVTITVDVMYVLWDVEATGGDRSATNGQPLEVFLSKRLSWRGTVTDATSGDYEAIDFAMEAQPIPSGMAQAIYDALAVLEYEGDVSIVQAEIAGGIHMGNKLNLSNGRTEWATMAAQIQSIVKDFGSGRTTLTIGPARHLAAGDLTRLFELTRYRRVFQNPATRQTGRASGAEQGVSLGSHAAKENTNTGLTARTLLRLLHTVEA